MTEITETPVLTSAEWWLWGLVFETVHDLEM
jgi:hypothetical protein